MTQEITHDQLLTIGTVRLAARDERAAAIERAKDRHPGTSDREPGRRGGSHGGLFVLMKRIPDVAHALTDSDPASLDVALDDADQLSDLRATTTHMYVGYRDEAGFRKVAYCIEDAEKIDGRREATRLNSAHGMDWVITPLRSLRSGPNNQTGRAWNRLVPTEIGALGLEPPDTLRRES